MLQRSLRLVSLLAAFVAFVAFVASSATSARADVGPAPSCPTGQTSSYYQGRYCSPTPCTAGASCGAGAVCAERGLCVQPRTADQPGIPPMAVGECEATNDCISPASCQRALFCGPPIGGTPAPVRAPAPAPAPAATDTATPAPAPAPATAPTEAPAEDCSVGPRGSSGAFGLVVTLCLAIVLMRRARA